MAFALRSSVSSHQQGAYVKALVSARGSGSVGFVLEDVWSSHTPPSSGLSTALLVDVGVDGAASTASTVVQLSANGTHTPIDRTGSFPCGINATCGSATITAIAPEHSHQLLLLYRRGMFEWYADDVLVQTLVYGGGYPLPTSGSGGRVGIACSGGAQFSLLSVAAGMMDLA